MALATEEISSRKVDYRDPSDEVVISGVVRKEKMTSSQLERNLQAHTATAEARFVE